MPRLDKRLPNRIRELRQERGWSEAQLGARCIPPMTATQIDKREKGTTAVTMDDMQRLAQALGCAPWDLFSKRKTDFERQIDRSAGLAGLLPPLQRDETLLLECYRGLAEPERRIVFAMIKGLRQAAD